MYLLSFIIVFLCLFSLDAGTCPSICSKCSGNLCVKTCTVDEPCEDISIPDNFALHLTCLPNTCNKGLKIIPSLMTPAMGVTINCTYRACSGLVVQAGFSGDIAVSCDGAEACLKAKIQLSLQGSSNVHCSGQLACFDAVIAEAPAATGTSIIQCTNAACTSSHFSFSSVSQNSYSAQVICNGDSDTKTCEYLEVHAPPSGLFLNCTDANSNDLSQHVVFGESVCSYSRIFASEDVDVPSSMEVFCQPWGVCHGIYIFQCNKAQCLDIDDIHTMQCAYEGGSSTTCTASSSSGSIQATAGSTPVESSERWKIPISEGHHASAGLDYLDTFHWIPFLIALVLVSAILFLFLALAGMGAALVWLREQSRRQQRGARKQPPPNSGDTYKMLLENEFEQGIPLEEKGDAAGREYYQPLIENTGSFDDNYVPPVVIPALGSQKLDEGRG
jgi:hypothetical protein